MSKPQLIKEFAPVIALTALAGTHTVARFCDALLSEPPQQHDQPRNYPHHQRNGEPLTPHRDRSNAGTWGNRVDANIANDEDNYAGEGYSSDDLDEDDSEDEGEDVHEDSQWSSERDLPFRAEIRNHERVTNSPVPLPRTPRRRGIRRKLDARIWDTSATAADDAMTMLMQIAMIGGACALGFTNIAWIAAAPALVLGGTSVGYHAACAAKIIKPATFRSRRRYSIQRP